MSIKPTFIDVMRHGEPAGICPKGGTILRGSTDHILTDKGWLQAKQRCQLIKNNGFSWDVIISSPLLRCAEFAEYIAKSSFKDNNKNRVSEHTLVIKNEWREIHYGDWDGKSTADIWQEQPELMEKMWSAPLEFCAPNGESVIDFSQRIEQAWSDLIEQFQGKRILLVCHGGVMRLLLQQLLMMKPEAMNRFAIPYAAMSRFRIDHSVSDLGITLNWPSLLAHYGDELTGDELTGESDKNE